MITYTRIITDSEQKILKNDLLDITDWINKAIEGRINHCLKVAAIQYDNLAQSTGLITVPVSLNDKVNALFAHPNYKNRTARDLEEKQQRESS